MCLRRVLDKSETQGICLRQILDKSVRWSLTLKHRITRKLLKVDRYMRRGVWQALNCLSIYATYCVIVAGASPEEPKMWAVVRENGAFVTVVSYTIL